MSLIVPASRIARYATVTKGGKPVEGWTAFDPDTGVVSLGLETRPGAVFTPNAQPGHPELFARELAKRPAPVEPEAETVPHPTADQEMVPGNIGQQAPGDAGEQPGPVSASEAERLRQERNLASKKPKTKR